MKRVSKLEVLIVVLDTKCRWRSTAASACSKLGIMRKASNLFGDLVLVSKVFGT